MKVIIRKFDPELDSGLIYSSYPKGVYYGAHTSQEHVPTLSTRDDPKVKSAWFKAFYAQVKNQLANSTVHIACPSDSTDTILGYAIIADKALEFIYVKELFRNQGIAKLLLTGHQVEHYKNVTKVGYAILHKEGNNGTN